VAFALVTMLGFWNGGYEDVAWGLMGTILLGASAIGLASGQRPRMPWPLALLAIALGALAAWTMLSSTWSESAGASLREGFRVLLYLGMLLAAAVFMRRGGRMQLLVGAWSGAIVIAVAALAGRLSPPASDGPLGKAWISGYRLSAPIGYWNALGLLACMGALIGIGLTAHARGRLLPAVGAASVPVFMLCAYFTFSRGAWAAMAVGLGAMLVLGPRRPAIAIGAAIAVGMGSIVVAAASASDVLVVPGGTAASARDAGGMLALGLVGAALGSAALASGMRAALRRMPMPAARRQRQVAWGAGAVALVALLASVLALGGPTAVGDRAQQAFSADNTTAPTGLNARLFSASGTGRADLWAVAARQADSAPLIGTGAGTFERHWLAERPTASVARDAHNLYLEALAEMGIVGLMLVLAVVSIPVVWAVRTRQRRSVGVAIGAFCALVAHAAIDWDWEMPVLVAIGGVCAVAITKSTRGDSQGSALSPAASRTLAGLAAAAALWMLVGFIGSATLAASTRNLAAGNADAALTNAERATWWAPWSAQAQMALGDARQAAGDHLGAVSAMREATRVDPGNWATWFALARVDDGVARAGALAQVLKLNPRSDAVAALLSEAPVAAQ
jgi:O-antigen ligase